jgi:hypothetical protein
MTLWQGRWVKLSSYNGAINTIISRWNGTSGWTLNVQPTGQVLIEGFNAGSANFSYALSYQSIPLNKWVHISAQLDMSTFTASTTTSYIMIDGVDVPCSVVRGGTNPTALVQAGNLEVGATNAGTLPFNGKIAQAFVSSAKITQANIRTLYSQGLTPALITANSIISAYSFNNAITDLNTTNANNLTANGSAVATNADSPMGQQADGTISSTLDYMIIQKATFSTNTTVTVQVPEGNIPTSGGVSAVVYSSQKAPYGMPTQRGKWYVILYDKVLHSISSPVATTWYNTSMITTPVGEWLASFKAIAQYQKASVNSDINITLSTGSSNETNPEFTTRSGDFAASTTNSEITHTTSPLPLSASVATPYYLNMKTVNGASLIAVRGDDATTVITLENAYI